MAFRKRTFPRKRPFGRPVARVRRTWNTNIRASWCNPYDVPILPCSDGRSQTKVAFQLVNQTILEDKFSDSACVKRVVGDLFWYPVYANPPPGQELVGGYQALAYWQAFAGLRKREINAQGVTNTYAPLDDDDDFGDAKWLKTWQHHAQAQGIVAVEFADHQAFYPVYKPDVHTYFTGVPGVPACSTLATGTGSICIETTGTTDCEPCDHTSSASMIQTQEPRIWHFHIDWKRKRGVYLRENEELVLDFNFAHPFLGGFASNGPSFQVFGGIKCLLQY